MRNDDKVKQQIIVMDLLKKGRPVPTLEFRNDHGIMSPAARIMELRRMGRAIKTIWTLARDARGKLRRNGAYLLVADEVAA